MDIRTCQVCSQTLPITRFRNAGFGRHKTCIPCVDAKRAATMAARTAPAPPPPPPPPRRTSRSPWEWTGLEGGPPVAVKIPDGWKIRGTPP